MVLHHLPVEQEGGGVGLSVQYLPTRSLGPGAGHSCSPNQTNSPTAATAPATPPRARASNTHPGHYLLGAGLVDVQVVNPVRVPRLLELASHAHAQRVPGQRSVCRQLEVELVVIEVLVCRGAMARGGGASAGCTVAWLYGQLAWSFVQGRLAHLGTLAGSSSGGCHSERSPCHPR